MRAAVIAALILGVSAYAAFAQQQEQIPDSAFGDFSRARILKINLLSPVAEAITLAYENVLTPEKSIQLTISVFSEGLVVTPEYRYYLSETYAPEGVYVAPYLRYYQFENEGILGGGLVIGRQGFYKKKITIDGFIGPSINSVNPFEESGVFFGVRAGITIGINFKRKK